MAPPSVSHVSFTKQLLKLLPETVTHGAQKAIYGTREQVDYLLPTISAQGANVQSFCSLTPHPPMQIPHLRPERVAEAFEVSPQI